MRMRRRSRKSITTYKKTDNITFRSRVTCNVLLVSLYCNIKATIYYLETVITKTITSVRVNTSMHLEQNVNKQTIHPERLIPVETAPINNYTRRQVPYSVPVLQEEKL